MVDFPVVTLKIFVMTAGILLGTGFKMLSCLKLPGNEEDVHFYDATIQCFDGYWFFGLFLCFAVTLFFVGLFIKIYRQNKEEKMSPYNTYRKILKPFKTKYWWFEFILFSRRFCIASFSSFRFVFYLFFPSIYYIN